MLCGLLGGAAMSLVIVAAVKASISWAWDVISALYDIPTVHPDRRFGVTHDINNLNYG
jgi:hypothetical protein